MSDQYSIKFVADILRQLPRNLRNETRSLSLVLSGEITEQGDNGVTTVKLKGTLMVYGEATSSFFQDKITAFVREKAGGRNVKDMMTTKKS